MAQKGGVTEGAGAERLRLLLGGHVPVHLLAQITPKSHSIHGVQVLTADDVKLNLGAESRRDIIRLFSHSVKDGVPKLDEILPSRKLTPQPGGRPEVYLHNPADHPGHPDYAYSTTEANPIKNPLLFVFSQNVMELPGMDRQEFEQFYSDPKDGIRTDWEVTAKEVPFTHPTHGQMLSFVVVAEGDVEKACKMLAKHDMKDIPVMPLKEWERIKYRYQHRYKSDFNVPTGLSTHMDILSSGRLLAERIGPEVETLVKNVIAEYKGRDALLAMTDIKENACERAGINPEEIDDLYAEIMESTEPERPVKRVRSSFRKLISRKMEMLAGDIPDEKTRAAFIEQELKHFIVRALEQEVFTIGPINDNERDRIHETAGRFNVPDTDQHMIVDSLSEMVTSVDDAARATMLAAVTSDGFLGHLLDEREPASSLHNLVVAGRKVAQADRPYFYTGIGGHLFSKRMSPVRRYNLLTMVVEAADAMSPEDRFWMYYSTPLEEGIGATVINNVRGSANIKKALETVTKAGRKVSPSGRRAFYFNTAPSAVTEYSGDLGVMESALNIGVEIGEKLPTENRAAYYNYTLPGAFHAYGSDMLGLAEGLQEVTSRVESLPLLSRNPFLAGTATGVMTDCRADTGLLKSTLDDAIGKAGLIEGMGQAMFYGATEYAISNVFGRMALDIDSTPVLEMGLGLPASQQPGFYGKAAPQIIRMLGESGSARIHPDWVNKWLQNIQAIGGSLPEDERSEFYMNETKVLLPAARDINPLDITVQWNRPGNQRQALNLIGRKAVQVDDALRRPFIETASVEAMKASSGDSRLLDDMLGVAVNACSMEGVDPNQFLLKTAPQIFHVYGPDIQGMEAMVGFVSNTLTELSSGEKARFWSDVVPAALGVYGPGEDLGKAVSATKDVSMLIHEPRRANFTSVTAVEAMKAFKNPDDLHTVLWAIHDICETMPAETRGRLYDPGGWLSKTIQESGGSTDKLIQELKSLQTEEKVEKISITSVFSEPVTKVLDNIQQQLSEGEGVPVRRVVTKLRTGSRRGELHKVYFIGSRDDADVELETVVVKNARGDNPKDPDRINDVEAAKVGSKIERGPYVYMADVNVGKLIEQELPVENRVELVGQSLSKQSCIELGRVMAQDFFVMHQEQNLVWPRVHTPHIHPIIMNAMDVVTEQETPITRYLDFRRISGRSDLTREEWHKRLRFHLQSTIDLYHQHLSYAPDAYKAFKERLLEIVADAQGESLPSWRAIFDASERELMTKGWYSKTPGQYIEFMEQAGVSTLS